MNSKRKSEKVKQDSLPKNSRLKGTASPFLSQKNLVAIVIILAATFICYLPVFHNGFVNWDDDHYIYENSLIHSIDIKVFFSEFVMGNYHPFVMTIYALIYKYFGLAPNAYHTVNLIFHLLNTWLVFVVFFSLVESFEIAFIVSLLFGIHPLHVESVAWVSELKDLMYTFFFLLALWQYVRYVKNNYKWKYYILTLLFFVCSLMSKAMGVSLVLILPLVDIFVQRRLLRGRSLSTIVSDEALPPMASATESTARFETRIWVEKIPFLVIGLLFGYIAIYAQRDYGAIHETSRFTFAERLIFACYGFITYIQRIFLPINLSAYYPYPIKTGGSIPSIFYFYPLLLAILFGFAIYSLKFTRKIFFSIGFFGATVFFVLQLLPVGDALTADRYSYVPSIGIFYLVAMGLMYLREKFSGRTIPILILVIISLCYGISTFQRVPAWKDGMMLWTDVINQSKNIAPAYINRADIKVSRKDYTGAIQDYTRSIELDPKFAIAYFNRGLAKQNLDDHEAAIKDYTKAIELNPTGTEAYYNRGIEKTRITDYAGAIGDYTKVIELEPKYMRAYYNRGIAKVGLEDYPGAMQDYTKAIELNPKGTEAYINRGSVKNDLGDYTAAIEDYDKAIELNPDNLLAYNNRGNAKEKLKDYTGAIGDYTKATELAPMADEAYYNRGIAKDRLKEYPEAIQDYTKTIELNPGHLNAYINRGNAKMYLKDYTGAIADYTMVIELDQKYAGAYCNRGYVKILSGDKNGGCMDLSKAIKLGNNPAVDMMRQYCK